MCDCVYLSLFVFHFILPYRTVFISLYIYIYIYCGIDILGETSVLHKHELNYAFYVLQGSSVEVRDESDKLLTTININAGETLSFNIDGDDLLDSTGTYRINRTHSAKNIGNSVFREILIEKKVSAIV